MVWSSWVVQSESKGVLVLAAEFAAAAAHRTCRSRDAAIPCDQPWPTAMAASASPRGGAVTPDWPSGGSDASRFAWVGAAANSAQGRTAGGLLPEFAAPGPAVVFGPRRGCSEVERSPNGVAADFVGLGACGPAGDAGVFVRRRGVAEPGVFRGADGLGFLADHAPGVVRRLRVVVVADHVPGGDQRGDRQREGVDDRQRRVGLVNRNQNQNRAERVTSLPGIGAKFFRNDVCTRASSSVRLRPRRSTSRIWLPRMKRRPTWALTIV